MLICPVCSEKLSRFGNVWRCDRGHSFDIAASGYCNLLIGSKPGEFTGDSRQMVAARRSFLDTGAYEPLREAVCQRVKELKSRHIVDAGCGEGYYTRSIADTAHGDDPGSAVVGIDISKAAVQYAAKRDRLTTYITASSYRMPVLSGWADTVLSVFAPTPAEEFRRVLAPGGRVLLAVPGKRHLWELKEAIYDVPYLNDEEKHVLAGFELTDSQNITYSTHVKKSEDIQNLFTMTPYIHRTSRDSMDRLMALEELDITFSFLLLTFEI